MGLWLVLMGLTGSLLSWKYEMIEWEARQQVSAPLPDPNGKTIPVSKVIAALEATNPDLRPERGIYLPVNKRGYYLHHARGQVDGKRVTQIYLIDPVTAKVYPPVREDSLWIDFTEKFHHNLLVGVKGTITNGFFTFFTLFLLASGIWLWWPSNLKQFKQRIWLKRSVSIRRTLYDLHNISGIYFYGLLFVVTLTGVLICYNGQTDQSIAKGINRLAGVKEIPRVREGEGGGREGAAARGAGRDGERAGRGTDGRGVTGRGTDNRADGANARGANAPGGTMADAGGRSGEGRGEEGRGEPLPVDVLVEKARTALPNNRVTLIRMPRRPGQPFLASYEFVKITSGGVPFDPYTGERLNSKVEAAFGRPPTPGASVMGAVFHLHYGWFGGNWSKILYCISGFLPLSLFITGVWMWGRKKKFELQKKAKLKNQTVSAKSVDAKPTAAKSETAKSETAKSEAPKSEAPKSEAPKSADPAEEAEADKPEELVVA